MIGRRALIAKGHAIRVENVTMHSTSRIGWGYALTAAGLHVRRAALPVALVGLVVFVLAGVAPFEGPLSPALAVVVPLSAFVACRIVGVGLGMGGWLFFPPDHRVLLGELAERAHQVDARPPA
jgi:hypothetical protein